jgi:UDP-glucose 4-epimerase
VDFYAGRRVLVTGGLGFIGSNLSIELVRRGAQVTILDVSVPGCGANLRNVASITKDVRIVQADIGDLASSGPVISGAEVIFNLAGEISHSHSMQNPERDLQVNTGAQVAFLAECTRRVPGVRIVYTSTRQVYGRPEYLPVDEDHPIAPVDYNGISKNATTQYHLMLARNGVLDAAVIRLTNTYGPRLALNIPCQGVLSVFFMRLLLGLPLEIFGDGAQLRDPLYVDDAVDAMLRIGAADNLHSRIYNVGGPDALPMGDIAAALCRAAGAPPPIYKPFPGELSKIDIGSFAADCRRIRRDLKWKPRIGIAEGAERTLAFFREHLADYLDVSAGYPSCPLHASAQQVAKASAPT